MKRIAIVFAFVLFFCSLNSSSQAFQVIKSVDDFTEEVTYIAGAIPQQTKLLGIELIIFVKHGEVPLFGVEVGWPKMEDPVNVFLRVDKNDPIETDAVFKDGKVIVVGDVALKIAREVMAGNIMVLKVDDDKATFNLSGSKKAIQIAYEGLI